MSGEEKDLRPASVVGILGIGAVCGFIGGTVVYADANLSAGQQSELSMSYPELAATTLAAAALIVTALGVMVALMALVGRSQIIAEAKKVAENRVREFLGDDGKPSDELRGILADRVDEVLLTDKDLHKILTERVDEIILKHAEMRLTGDGTQSSENEDNGNEDWGDPDSEYGDDR